MKKSMVALITPFHQDGSIDFPSLHELMERLLKEGCDGFIVCGTTAETPALSIEERFEILEYAIEVCAKRCEIWFGCGSNNTSETVSLAQRAQSYDIDGLLIVTPYYNRPSQAGLYAHFASVAANAHKNIMMYNVPSRTGVALTTQTAIELCSDFPNIVALKQASKDFDMVKNMKAARKDVLIYSGEDGMLKEGLDAGMDGIVSVSGHLNLPDIKAYQSAYEKGEAKEAMDQKLKEFAAYVFCESSPAPLKYMMSIKGMCENVLRLPLVPLSKEKRIVIDQIQDKF